MFGIFAGIAHWFPLFTGLTINPKWLKLHFLVIFTGVNITFFPQHFLGLNDIPRRYSDYPDAYTPWNVIQQLCSSESLLLLIVILISSLFILFYYLRITLSRYY